MRWIHKYQKMIASLTLIMNLPNLGVASLIPIPEAPVPMTQISLQKFEPTEIAEWGRVERLHISNPESPTVVFIRDAHALKDAQINIQNIIRFFQQKHGVQFVALEGAMGEIDPTLLRNFPDHELRDKILSQDLATGELSGAEIASVENEIESVYTGIEDWELYRKNWRAYLDAMEVLPQIEEEITKILTGLDKRKTIIYQPEHIKFHDLRRRFLENDLDLSNYLKTLKPYFQLNPVDNYPRLKTLVNALSDSALTSQESLTSEALQWAKSLLLSYQTMLNKDQIMIINHAIQSLSTGTMDAASLIADVLRVLSQEGYSIEIPDKFRMLLDQKEDLKEIEGSDLYLELANYLDEYEARYAQSEEIQTLMAEFKSVTILHKMVRLEISKPSWMLFKQDKQRYLNLLPEPEISSPAQAFYQYVEDRDQMLFENMHQLMIAKQSNSAIVVMGGFHTDGFEQQLQQIGISYLIVSPKAEGLAGHEQYNRLMQADFTYLSDKDEALYQGYHRYFIQRVIAEIGSKESIRLFGEWQRNLRKYAQANGSPQKISQYLKDLEVFKEIILKETRIDAIPLKSNQEVITVVERIVDDYRQDYRDDLLDQELTREMRGVSEETSGLQSLRQALVRVGGPSITQIRGARAGGLTRASSLGSEDDEFDQDDRIFTDLMAAIHKEGKAQLYSDGDELIRQGDSTADNESDARGRRNDDLFFILSGEVDISRTDRDADGVYKTVHITTLKSDDVGLAVVGEISGINGGVRTASVKVKGFAFVARVSRKEILEIDPTGKVIEYLSRLGEERRLESDTVFEAGSDSSLVSLLSVSRTDSVIPALIAYFGGLDSEIMDAREASTRMAGEIRELSDERDRLRIDLGHLQNYFLKGDEAQEKMRKKYGISGFNFKWVIRKKIEILINSLVDEMGRNKEKVLSLRGALKEELRKMPPLDPNIGLDLPKIAEYLEGEGEPIVFPFQLRPKSSDPTEEADPINYYAVYTPYPSGKIHIEIRNINPGDHFSADFTYVHTEGDFDFSMNMAENSTRGIYRQVIFGLLRANEVLSVETSVAEPGTRLVMETVMAQLQEERLTYSDDLTLAQSLLLAGTILGGVRKYQGYIWVTDVNGRGSFPHLSGFQITSKSSSEREVSLARDLDLLFDLATDYEIRLLDSLRIGLEIKKKWKEKTELPLEDTELRLLYSYMKGELEVQDVVSSLYISEERLETIANEILSELGSAMIQFVNSRDVDVLMAENAVSEAQDLISRFQEIVPRLKEKDGEPEWPIRYEDHPEKKARVIAAHNRDAQHAIHRQILSQIYRLEEIIYFSKSEHSPLSAYTKYGVLKASSLGQDDDWRALRFKLASELLLAQLAEQENVRDYLRNTNFSFLFGNSLGENSQAFFNDLHVAGLGIGVGDSLFGSEILKFSSSDAATVETSLDGLLANLLTPEITAKLRREGHTLGLFQPDDHDTQQAISETLEYFEGLGATTELLILLHPSQKPPKRGVYPQGTRHLSLASADTQATLNNLGNEIRGRLSFLLPDQLLSGIRFDQQLSVFSDLTTTVSKQQKRIILKAVIAGLKIATLLELSDKELAGLNAVQLRNRLAEYDLDLPLVSGEGNISRVLTGVFFELMLDVAAKQKIAIAA